MVAAACTALYWRLVPELVSWGQAVAQTLTVGPGLEFKEIRKEWKARKKEEEQRKVDDDRRVHPGVQNGGSEAQAGPDGGPPPGP